MSEKPRFVVLLDGGFVIKKFQQANKHFPTAAEIEGLCSNIAVRPEFEGYELLRNYFYHATPASGVVVNPLDHSQTDLSATRIHSQHESLVSRLELTPNFAVRLGETVANDWRLGSAAMKALTQTQRPIQAADLVPNITQKGVDLRIGMDIARLSLREVAVPAEQPRRGSDQGLDLVLCRRTHRRSGGRSHVDNASGGRKRNDLAGRAGGDGDVGGMGSACGSNFSLTGRAPRL